MGNTVARRAAEKRAPRKKKRAPRTLGRFYRDALSEAERENLDEAGELEGFDHELAVLRVKLKSALEERPNDLALMLRGIELLVKAISAQYRMSKDEQQDLDQSLRQILEEFGGQMMPEPAS